MPLLHILWKEDTWFRYIKVIQIWLGLKYRCRKALCNLLSEWLAFFFFFCDEVLSTRFSNKVKDSAWWIYLIVSSDTATAMLWNVFGISFHQTHFWIHCYFPSSTFTVQHSKVRHGFMALISLGRKATSARTCRSTVCCYANQRCKRGGRECYSHQVMKRQGSYHRIGYTIDSWRL